MHTFNSISEGSISRRLQQKFVGAALAAIAMSASRSRLKPLLQQNNPTAWGGVAY